MSWWHQNTMNMSFKYATKAGYNILAMSLLGVDCIMGRLFLNLQLTTLGIYIPLHSSAMPIYVPV